MIGQSTGSPNPQVNIQNTNSVSKIDKKHEQDLTKTQRIYLEALSEIKQSDGSGSEINHLPESSLEKSPKRFMTKQATNSKEPISPIMDI